MPAVAVLNQKGGVLKTTATVNVAQRLARRDLRVLVIDLDKQASATTTLRADEIPAEQRDIANVLAAPDTGKPFALETAITHTDPQWDGVELVPASLELEAVWSSGKPMLVFRLRRAIDDAGLFDLYDWILMDGPPDLGAGTVSAVAAADEVVVPFRPERMALEGVAKTIDTVNVVRREMGANGSVTALLAAAVDDRVGEHVNRVNEARELYGDLLFTSSIPHRLKSDEASGKGIPASMLEAPAGPALEKAYDAVTDELIERTKAE